MTVDVNLTRLGQKNVSGATDALFRDKFIPELLSAFDEKRVVKNYVRSKSIDSGKSASFPVLGKTDAKYVLAGETLLGNQTIAKNEVTINMDPFLVSDIEIAEIDTLLTNFDDREYIKLEMARALANAEDKQLLQTGCLAARAAGIVSGRSGGSQIHSVGCDMDGALLTAAIYKAGVTFDEKDVPEEDRVAFVRPLQYSLMAQVDKNTNQYLGGGGIYSEGTTGKINNIQIIKTNHLPNSNILAGTGVQANNIYYGDFSNTAALVMNRQAVGTVSRKNVTVEASWDPRRLSWLLTARVLQGHGILRSDCAVEIMKNAAV